MLGDIYPTRHNLSVSYKVFAATPTNPEPSWHTITFEFPYSILKVTAQGIDLKSGTQSVEMTVESHEFIVSIDGREEFRISHKGVDAWPDILPRLRQFLIFPEVDDAS